MKDKLILNKIIRSMADRLARESRELLRQVNALDAVEDATPSFHFFLLDDYRRNVVACSITLSQNSIEEAVLEGLRENGDVCTQQTALFASFPGCPEFINAIPSQWLPESMRGFRGIELDFHYYKQFLPKGPRHSVRKTAQET
jgi:hypothetical protein